MAVPGQPTGIPRYSSDVACSEQVGLLRGSAGFSCLDATTNHGESDVKTMTQAEIPAFLVELEDAFNKAMISNDVERISRCVTDDWILVTPEAGPVPRARILEVIGSGLLTHATMTKTATHACVAGDVAWVTGRGQNTGTFNGEPIEADEYITDIYRRVGGEWRCVLTHLTPAG